MFRENVLCFIVTHPLFFYTITHSINPFIWENANQYSDRKRSTSGPTGTKPGIILNYGLCLKIFLPNL